MCYKHFILSFLLILLPIKISSQTIEVDIPSCYALPYTFSLNKGAKKDTIITGRLDTLGYTSFTLPDKHKTYRGVGTLSIQFGKQNINIILNEEEKIVVNEIADTDDWKFSVSDENKYLLDALAKQRDIIGRYNNQTNGYPNYFRTKS